jgi:hypothetical protein
MHHVVSQRNGGLLEEISTHVTLLKLLGRKALNTKDSFRRA